MKKMILVLAVLVLAAPALAGNVTITAVDEGNGVVRIGYTADANVSAFGLDITVDDGNITAISDYNVGECTASVKGFGIFMGTIVIDELGIITDDGTPVAPNDAPGALGVLGTSGITIEMGALYEDGNNPALTGTLCRVTVDTLPCNLTVAGNVTRGNVVLEDATQASLTGITIPVGGTSAFDTQHADYQEWLDMGEPVCWTYKRQCYGDADGLKEGLSYTGYYYVGSNDLGKLASAWKIKEPPKAVAPYLNGISDLPGGICADFDRAQEGLSYTGYYRVGSNDLGILATYWKIKEPLKGPGIPSTGCGGDVEMDP